MYLSIGFRHSCTLYVPFNRHITTEQGIRLLLLGDSGHMFTDIDPGPHTIAVVCTSTGSGVTTTATSTFYVTGKELTTCL